MGIFDLIWPSFGAPRWGLWPKNLLKSQMPHICPGSPPSGLTLIGALSTSGGEQCLIRSKYSSHFSFWETQLQTYWTGGLLFWKPTWRVVVSGNSFDHLCLGRTRPYLFQVFIWLKEKVNVDSSQCFFNGCKAAPGPAVGEPVNLIVQKIPRK